VLAQAFLGIRHRTWGFLIAMLIGTILEAVGYGGRIAMHNDIFTQGPFITYLCCLTIGPALFSAAIYLSLSRIITIYGPSLSFMRPRTITLTFISCDILSLVLQAVGGALASTASTPESRDTGVNIMIAGLSTQVAATTAFSATCILLAWNIRRHPDRVITSDTALVAFRATRAFRLFLVAIGIATVTILIRCSFRVAELSEGFKGDLANDETLFMIFDGAMMLICVLVLTLAHPGITLKERWNTGEFHWRSRKAAQHEKNAPASSGASSEHAPGKEARYSPSGEVA
jgi:hypothetical protein